MTNLVLTPQATVELPSQPKVEKPSLQSDLQSVFQEYAALYPNPRLSKERQDRESLIRALSAAGEATERNPKAVVSRGIFGRLFGGGKDEQHSQAKAAIENFDESRLEYTIEDDESNHALCGTENFSLDASCIPPEAYMMARFRIASRHRRINTARNAWQHEDTIMVIITGLGQLIEVSEEKQTPSSASSNVVCSTSDRADLEEYLMCTADIEFSPDRVRACLVGPFFMVVSWGLPDGVVVCYRKVQRNPKKTSKIGWQAVARIRPTKVAQSNLADIFSEDDGPSLAPLLTVTDAVPLVVETEDDIVPDVSLALGRLGGYIEIVPLPPRLWYGTEVPLRRPGSVKKGVHYASSLPDLAQMRSIAERIITVPTMEYHGDILGLEVFRTRVKEDTVWDQGIYPDRPPAEHVLIAHGCNGPNGTEQLTFWAVSTLYTAEPNAKDDVNFSLHATLAEAIDLGPLVPPMTIFANDSILRYWRKPRQVKLREPGESFTPNEGSGDTVPLTTISVSMPLLVVRVSHSDEITVLSVLDSCGGVAVLDCSLLERLVSQSLSVEERDQVFGAAGGSLPLADFLFDRTYIHRMLSTSDADDNIQPLRIFDIAFLPMSVGDRVATSTPFMALLARRRLLIVSMEEIRRGNVYKSILVARESLICSFHVGSPLCLNVVIQHTTGSILKIFGISSLKHGVELIGRMIEEGKDLEAVKAAESLAPSDRTRLQKQLDSCRRRLWENRAHLESLLAISNESYQLRQILSASEAKVPAVNNSHDQFDLVRSALGHIMGRLKTASLGSAVSMCGSQGVDAMITLLRRRYILLGSYELICRQMGVNPTILGFAEDFLSVPISDMAFAFAKQGMIDALSVFYFRHSIEIDMRILEMIPLSISPSQYQHLVPIANSDDDDRFLFTSGEGEAFKPFDCLDLFLKEKYEVETCIDDDDKVMISSEHAAVHLIGVYPDRDELEKVLLQRLRRIEVSCGSLEFIVEFCDIALRALRADALPVSEAVSTILHIKSNASLLADLEVRFDYTDNSLDCLSIMKATELSDMDPSALMLLFLRMGLSPEELMKVVNSQLRPDFLDSKSVTNDEFDSLVSESCRKLISSSGTEELVRTLESISSVCRLSRSSLFQKERLVKKTGKLLELVLAVINELVRVHGSNKFASADGCQIMEVLWKMYECLPVSFPQSALSSQQNSERIDHLKNLLIVGDVASRWRGCDFLALLRLNSSHAGTFLETELRNTIVKEICRACLGEIESRGNINTHATFKMFESLVLDLREILAISEGDAMDAVLCLELFVPLLQKMQIPTLRNLILLFGEELFERESAQKALIAFTNDAVFSTEGGQNVEAAIACEKSLAEFYPDLKPHFESIRQCLNVAHFVNSVIFFATGDYLSPDTVKESDALEVMRYVLATNPQCVLKDCEEWGDENFGTKANRHLRQIEDEDSGYSPLPTQPPPRLPCVAVFHLAELLGLVDEQSVLVVKSLAVEACIMSEHFNAAAAICRLLFTRGKSSAVTDRVILRTVALLVRDARFVDDETKLELCQKSFSILAEIQIEVSEFLHDSGLLSILASFQGLLDQNDSDSICHFPFFLFHDVARPSISDRVHQFSHQAVKSETDEAVVSSLGDTILKEFASKCTSKKEDFPSLREDDLFALMDFGLSLLCHCVSTESAIQSLDKVEAMLESSKEMFENGHYASVADNPDVNVVQKLVEMGYSESSATRAASTAGSDFNQALRWAVAHSLDTGFDEPIVILKEKEASWSTEMYRVVMSKINATRVMLKRGSSSELFCSPYHYEPIGSNWEAQSQRMEDTSRPSPVSGEQTLSEPSEDPYQTSPKYDTRMQSRGVGYTQIGTDLAQPRWTDKKLRKVSGQTPSAVHRISDNAGSTEYLRSEKASKSDPGVLAESEARMKTPEPSQSPLTEVTKAKIFDAKPLDRVLPQFTSGSPLNSESRDALRKMGLDALNSARSITSSTEKSDRQRLIEEGRRLLALTRPSGGRGNTASSQNHPLNMPRRPKVTFGPSSYHIPGEETTEPKQTDLDEGNRLSLNGRTSSISPYRDTPGSTVQMSVNMETWGKDTPANRGSIRSTSTTPPIKSGADIPSSLPRSENEHGWEFHDPLDGVEDQGRATTSSDLIAHQSPSSHEAPNDGTEQSEGWNFDEDLDGVPPADDGWDFDDNI